jgi:hypothetical protein
MGGFKAAEKATAFKLSEGFRQITTRGIESETHYVISQD